MLTNTKHIISNHLISSRFNIFDKIVRNDPVAFTTIPGQPHLVVKERADVFTKQTYLSGFDNEGFIE